MSKHHHQDKAEQILHRSEGVASFHQDKDFTKDQRESLIQERAYHLHHSKGGSALDNWLEAERFLIV